MIHDTDGNTAAVGHLALARLSFRGDWLLVR